jgi:hypothetical protein
MEGLSHNKKSMPNYLVRVDIIATLHCVTIEADTPEQAREKAVNDARRRFDEQGIADDPEFTAEVIR